MKTGALAIVAKIADNMRMLFAQVRHAASHVDANASARTNHAASTARINCVSATAAILLSK